MEKLYQSYTTAAVFSKYDEATFSSWGDLYFQKRILPHFPKDKNAKILELGCGYGRYLRSLENQGYTDIAGLDISPEQVAIAKEKMKLSKVELGDALEFLKTTENKYDVIFMLDVVEHLSAEYSVELAAEALKALKAEGKLILQVPNAMCPMQPLLYGDVTHKQSYTTLSMKQLLISAGFKDISFHSLPTIVHGMKSIVRRMIWHVLIEPIIKFYLIVTCGELMGGIYTPNFLTVTKK